MLYEDFRIEYAAMPLEDGRLGELDIFGNSYPLITYYGGLRTRLLNFRKA